MDMMHVEMGKMAHLPFIALLLVEAEYWWNYFECLLRTYLAQDQVVDTGDENVEKRGGVKSLVL